ncbi:hypothetical protein Cch01nite_17010 [Cellulomonas chitinilytica]|uniref:Uncharacterized protein n=1 Tax=Cellulomonas chitinilytica TaxID=398759 RepID=A0A919U1Z7_9CELL|nr:hypothetical protein [Cellulomonas chitinilytica]GIG20977.1 hypothetical protein Cch01nite_17010 [Cellulomonas chitinilytica]
MVSTQALSKPGASERPELFHTADGTRRHLRFCSHFSDTPADRILEAAVDDGRPLCEWSAAEIAGQGQTRFETLDEALEAYRAPLENRDRMREVAAGFTYDKVWMPNSGSYVAIAVEGQNALAYFGKTYLWTAAGGTETLTGYVAGAGTGPASTRTQDERTCPTHHLSIPATGVCDYCA